MGRWKRLLGFHQFLHSQSCSTSTWKSARRYHSISGVKPVDDVEFRELVLGSGGMERMGRTTCVAFSGGPDSTALLFLLHRLLSNENTESRRKVLAIHVDHGLQAQSGRVAEHCASLARVMDVEFLAVKIPWGTSPFPPLPAYGEPFEKVARDARFHIFMDAMRKRNIDTIAFGHHCDDQVETALLRLSKGSSLFGLAGMRSLRRWGMGSGADASSLGWAGHHGMQKWVLRPLLTVPKERLVATCCANRLQVVTDPTNFDPAITERNSIRNDLKMVDSGRAELSKSLHTMKDLLFTAQAECGLNANAKELRNVTVPNLRSAVNVLSTHMSDIETKATLGLQSCTMPTIPSCVLLSLDSLRSITDPAIRVAMVRRILRFVSPCPWGSPAAEAGGRQTSLQSITDKIWGKSPDLSHPPDENRKPFVAGAGVQWSPVVILPTGDFKTRNISLPGEKLGWLAHRQPPFAKRGELVHGGDIQDPLHLEITHLYFDALSKDRGESIMYDNRFVVNIRPSPCPDGSEATGGPYVRDHPDITVHLDSHSRYFLPRIVAYPGRHTEHQNHEAREIGRISLRGLIESPSSSNNKSPVTHVPRATIRVDLARTDEATRNIMTSGHMGEIISRSMKIKSPCIHEAVRAVQPALGCTSRDVG